MALKKKPAHKDTDTNKKPISDITDNAKDSIKTTMETHDMFLRLGEFVFRQAKEKIENNQLQYLGEGQEGVVYKVQIDLADNQKMVLLAVKRRHDNEVKAEMDMQKRFRDVAQKSTTGVQVPEGLGGIDTNQGKYFLMEYVDGKTLFTLKMEKIAGYFYDRFKDKYPDFFQAIKYLNKNIERGNINRSSRFHFANDGEARAGMYQIVNLLNDMREGLIQKYTQQANVLLDKKTFEKVVEKIYYDADIQPKIFDLKTGREAKEKIKKFLQECHKAGLFHRDLGGNPTNIMFKQKDGEIIPVIIDFGKSEAGSYKENEYERGKGPYQVAGRGGDMDGAIPDMQICDIIDGLTHKPEKKEPREL